MAKKPEPLEHPQTEVVDLAAPNPGELDVLSVLWVEREGENRALQLAEVHRRVCERRRRYGEPEPALTTVSTHLRKLTIEKKLIEEIVAGRAAEKLEGTAAVRTRGYRPPTRSPQTSYRVLYGPGEVLQATFFGLAEAYPPTLQRRLDALLDFARILGLPNEILARIAGLIAIEQKATGPTTAGGG